MSSDITIYLEAGERRVFSGALEWPGWCRSGPGEDEALGALIDYGPRYQAVVQGAGVAFEPPADISRLEVVERLKGDSTTDFGAPGTWPEYDSRSLTDNEAERLISILEACWRKFDTVVEAAGGRELRKGPRGGGRDLEAIVDHVIGAQISYLGMVGRKPAKSFEADVVDHLSRIRQAAEGAVRDGVRGELPTEGPRGGTRWTARYFVRRAAWHVLDHAWEIEDRVQ